MADEKLFTIPLRKEFLKKPKYRRTKKAVTTVKEFITRHLKVKVVNIGSNLNHAIWSRGKRNPPTKIKVKVIVEDKVAYVELPEFEFVKAKPKEEEKSKKDDHKDHNHESHDTEKAEAHKPTKEQEKELNQELKKEEQSREKKEHHPTQPGTPNDKLKQGEKGIEDKAKRGRVVGSTGKK